MKILSPIQNHILSELKSATMLRYRDLHPGEIPNDLFNYHLQFLVKKGFVSREEGGYALTQSGVGYIADMQPSESNKKISSLFKVNVITVLSRVVSGKIEILSQERRRHPSFGKVGVIGGIAYKGELLTEAARRKCKEETGLIADFKHIGIERRRLYQSGALFSDVLFPIFYAHAHTGNLVEENEFGRNFFVPIAQAIRNESSPFDSLQSLPRVLRSIQRGTINKLSFFFTEATQESDC